MLIPNRQFLEEGPNLVGRDLIFGNEESDVRARISKVVLEDGNLEIYVDWHASRSIGSDEWVYVEPENLDLSDDEGDEETSCGAVVEWGILPVGDTGYLTFSDQDCHVYLICPEGDNLNPENIKNFPTKTSA